jgi:uncharacterized protein (TIGR03435 family)
MSFRRQTFRHEEFEGELRNALVMQNLRASKIVVTIGLTIAARAQTVEVAAIKPHSAEIPCPKAELLRSGILVVGCFTLDLIVRESLNVLPDQIKGGPEWVRHDLWDITAKAEGVSADSGTDVVYRKMLRTLAVERFHLRLRSEKKQVW